VEKPLHWPFSHEEIRMPRSRRVPAALFASAFAFIAGALVIEAQPAAGPVANSPANPRKAADPPKTIEGANGITLPAPPRVRGSTRRTPTPISI
jgi:hypothetical protein